MDKPRPVLDDDHYLINDSATFESFCVSVDKPHFHSSKNLGDLTHDDESTMYNTCWEDSIKSDTSTGIHLNDPNITTSTQYDKSTRPALASDHSQIRIQQLPAAIGQSDNRTTSHTSTSDQSDNRTTSHTSTSDQSDTNSDFVIIPTPAGSQDGDKCSNRGSTSNQSGTSSEFVVIHTPDYQNSSFDIISNKPETSDESVFNDDASEDCFLNISGTVDHENQTIIYTETPVRASSAVKCCHDYENAAAADCSDETTEDTLTASNTHDATNNTSDESTNTTIVGIFIKPEMNEEKDDVKLVAGEIPDSTIHPQDASLNEWDTTTNRTSNKAKEADTNEDEIMIRYYRRDRRVHSSSYEIEEHRNRRFNNVSNEMDKNRNRVHSLSIEIEENIMKTDQVEQWLSHNAACRYNEDIGKTQSHNKDDKSDENSDCNNNDCGLVHISKTANHILEGKVDEIRPCSYKRQVAEVGPFRNSSEVVRSVTSDEASSSIQHQHENHNSGSTQLWQYNKAASSTSERFHGTISSNDSTNAGARFPGTIHAVAERLRSDGDGIMSAEYIGTTDVPDMNNNTDSIPTIPGSMRGIHAKTGSRKVEMCDKQTQTDWEFTTGKPDTSRIKVIIRKVRDAACWLWNFLTRLCHNIASYSTKTADRLCQWLTTELNSPTVPQHY